MPPRPAAASRATKYSPPPSLTRLGLPAVLASLRAFFMALSMRVSVAAMLGNSLPLAATFGQLPSFLLGSSDLTQSYADMKKALSD